MFERVFNSEVRHPSAPDEEENEEKRGKTNVEKGALETYTASCANARAHKHARADNIV